MNERSGPSKASGPSRRFVISSAAAAGGGLIVGFDLFGPTDRALAQRPPAAPSVEIEVNAWLAIRPDSSVVVRMTRSDLGQGTITGLAQLVTEELECDWAKVATETVSPGRNLARNNVWQDFATNGSRGLRGAQLVMRQAGAAARLMLLEAAAKELRVPQSELTTAAGVIQHRASGRSTTYGRVAAAAVKLRALDPSAIKLKPSSAWRLAGTSPRRPETALKITGRAIYGIDVTLPGMLCAAVRDAPVFGAKLKAFDPETIRTFPGVQHILRVGDTAVAVVADTWWQAKSALEKLAIAWEPTPDAAVNSQKIADYLKEGLDAAEAFVGRTHGDALKAIGSSAKTIEAVYATPFLHHATLEPMNCTALWTPEKVEVWAPTQNADATLRAAAEAAQLPIAKAEVHRTLVGGAFGRRVRQDYVTDAVIIARQVPGVPIKLIWSREEDTTHGFYRPITQCKLIGGLDEKGEVTGLIMRISGQSILASQSSRSAQAGRDARMFQGLLAELGEAQMGYSFPNLYIDHAMRNTHIPVGNWRGVYTTQNAVYLECFIDELAHAAGKDPLEFRRAMMKSHSRHLTALVAASEKANWGQPLPTPQFRGLAQFMAYGSYTAAVAEVSVDSRGLVLVHRLTIAIDSGEVVNPDQVKAQIEGSAAMALSATLKEEITIRDGRVVETNFDALDVLRLAELPPIEVVLVPSGEGFGGVGEAAVGVVAPAVLNAVFAATGRRVRSLPLRRVKLS